MQDSGQESFECSHCKQKPDVSVGDYQSKNLVCWYCGVLLSTPEPHVGERLAAACPRCERSRASATGWKQAQPRRSELPSAAPARIGEKRRTSWSMVDRYDNDPDWPRNCSNSFYGDGATPRDRQWNIYVDTWDARAIDPQLPGGPGSLHSDPMPMSKLGRVQHGHVSMLETAESRARRAASAPAGAVPPRKPALVSLRHS
eukprot:2874738-Pyramimonas_sp.AAC.1